MGKSKTPEPPKPNVGQEAQQITNARIATDPQLAQSSYNIQANPNYGALPLTQLYESIRQQVFPNQSAVSNQLSQNVLGQLQSPTGYTPEQQAALDARRGLAQNNLVTALRNRANLGGNLYSGLSGQQEANSVSDLQNQFAVEDISNQRQARNDAYSQAIPILQMLYNQQIQTPQFQSATQDPNTYANNVQQSNIVGYNAQRADDLARSQLYTALFSTLGEVPKQIAGFAGGGQGGTVGNTGKTQSQILGYNTANYR